MRESGAREGDPLAVGVALIFREADSGNDDAVAEAILSMPYRGADSAR
jgi:hypothetical protein